MASLTLVKCTI